MSRRARSTNRLAVLISRLFDPTWLIPLMLVAAVAWSMVNGFRWRFVLLLVFVDGLIPFLYFVHLLRTKQISDWDTTKRTQRHRLYWFTVVVHAIGVLMALILGKITLAKILFSFWILALVYATATLRWKISVHTGVSAAGIAFVVYLFGWEWAMLFLLVGLIGWARVAMGKHGWSQVVLGALLAPLLLISMFWLMGVGREEARMPSEVNIIHDYMNR